jgi:L-threonylcarbamoyladenylate synthase
VNNYYDNIKKAAEIINSGELAAFPTETVYGLGANAFDVAAVKKIFEAKGRPSDNPLIVHIGGVNDLERLVSDKDLNQNELAAKLVKAFWPGPLTLIFKKSDLIPDEVTAGQDTVAVRFPKNKIALDFINECGVPIAAPSANISGRPSPTRASHVEFDFGGKVFIIDGGPCEYGLESTIIDVSSNFPAILRPGSITREMICDATGIHIPPETRIETRGRPKAPGVKYPHYSPKAKVIIIKSDIESAARIINAEKNVGAFVGAKLKKYFSPEVFVIDAGATLEETASNLYKALRNFDYKKIETVYVENFPAEGVGEAVMNRLNKAATDFI